LSYREAIENWALRVKELSTSGRTVLGYVYPHVPLELLLAHGITPSLMWADPDVQGGFESSLQTFSCSLTRNLFSQRSNGRLSSFEGFLFPANTCDSLLNVADVWRRRFPEDKIFKLTYPAGKLDEASVQFLAEELRIFSESLKTRFERALSSRDLLAAASLVNEFRIAAQTLYSSRIVDPDLVSYFEVAGMVREFLTIPNADAVSRIGKSAAAASQKLGERGLTSVANSVRNGLLNGTFDSVKITAESSTPRILIVGGMVEPLAVESLFKGSTEQSHCVVVSDLLSSGFRTVFTPAVSLEGDPFVAMSRSILRAPSELTQEGLPTRLGFLKAVVSGLAIDGLVVCEQSFCDPDQFEAPSLLHVASELGLPSVRLPLDPELSDRSRLQGRIESFLEVVREGRT